MATLLKTYFTTFYRSIFSPPLYADVIHRWKGTGALYTLCLSLFIAVVLSTRLAFTLLSVGQDRVDYMLNQIPVITVSQGEITTDTPRPHDIKLEDGTVFMRFLEKADLNTVKEENKDIPIIVTSTQLIIMRDQEHSRRDELRVQELDGIDDMVLDRTALQNLWNKGRWSFPLIVIPFVAIGLWIGYFLQIAVIAIISYVVTAFMKEEYIFETRIRMAAVAFTPVLFANQLSEMILHHKLNFVMMAAMATLYIFVMIRTSRQVS